nr:hypothetical protein L203_01582 [Cryptococcus depauperatus CBS 7841]
MSSLPIGSSDGSHGLTQHGPSQSHLPAPLTSSQTRKQRRITKSNPSATNADRHNDVTDQIPSSVTSTQLAVDSRMDTRGHQPTSRNGDAPPPRRHQVYEAK